MNLSSTCFVVLLLLALLCVGSAAQNSINVVKMKNYITWDDLKLDNRKFDLIDRNSRGSGSSSVSFRDRVIVVDRNGYGESLTVQGAVDMVPINNAHRVKIHILPGVYREKVHIPGSKPYISFIGDENQPNQTVITWHDKAGDRDTINGGLIGTWNSASVTVESDYFCASGITFENTIVEPYGGLEGYQAVALRISGDLAVFHKVRFLGSQDTLLDEKGSHYFYRCFIQGATDFIFGNARSLYQECEISAVWPAFAITAHHRNSADEDTGFAFVNCTVTGNGHVYLGRAWGDYARVIYSYTEFDIHVTSGGWHDWNVPSRDKTTMFGEYKCRGRGANRTGRVSWSKALNYTDARPFLDSAFISGSEWLRL